MGLVQIIIAGLVFLLPLFFLPTTVEFYSTNKLALLFLAAPLLLIFWIIFWLKEKRVLLKQNKLNLVVVIFALTFIASTVIVSQNIITSLISPLGTGTVVSLVILYFVIANLITDKKQVIIPLVASGFCLSFFFLIQFIGLTNLLPFTIVKNPLFTPLGFLYNLPIVLLALIPLSVSGAFKEKKPVLQVFFSLTTVAMILTIIFSIITLTSNKPSILPLEASWQIAIDAIKNLKTAFLGVGPGNFLNAFTQYKPLSFNNTDFWMMRFDISGSFLLQLLSEVGLLGAIAYCLIFTNFLAIYQKDRRNPLFFSLLILFTASLFLPGSLVGLFLTFIILGLISREKSENSFQEQSVIFPRTSLVVTVMLLLIVYWFGFRWYLGEIYFRDSQVAASQNQAAQTYDLEIKAIETNPYLDLYHLTYSQTNLALASSLAQKDNPSDSDRQNITLLIQQAIREAKLATSLNPNKAANWSNLAFIYRNLLNAANGADNWTVTAYIQAVKLDPLNPLLRIDLGGVYYSLKNYDSAIQQFNLAVNLKPDYANAHYNLSAALREKGDYQNAFREMQTTLSLVDPNSDDFRKASTELESLREKIPATSSIGTPTSPETLTEPKGKAVEIKPKIDLPKEQAAPELPEVSPSENISPTEKPSPKPTNKPTP